MSQSAERSKLLNKHASEIQAAKKVLKTKKVKNKK